MASTRKTLDDITANLEESMGVRKAELYPVLAPAPGMKDAGRRPLRNFGRVVISHVIPDPQQPRIEFAEEDLEQLALSITEGDEFLIITAGDRSVTTVMLREEY